MREHVFPVDPILCVLCVHCNGGGGRRSQGLLSVPIADPWDDAPTTRKADELLPAIHSPLFCFRSAFLSSYANTSESSLHRLVSTCAIAPEPPRSQ